MGLKQVNGSGLFPKNVDYWYNSFDIGDCPSIQRGSICGNV